MWRGGQCPAAAGSSPAGPLCSEGAPCSSADWLPPLSPGLDPAPTQPLAAAEGQLIQEQLEQQQLEQQQMEQQHLAQE